MANTVKITLTKSVIGASPAQRRSIEALGLRKLNQTVERTNDEVLRGVLNKVGHLVTVTEK